MSLRDITPVAQPDAKLTAVVREAAAAPLPSPSGVALEVMRLTRDDNVTVKKIAEALSADPALSGRLIEVANSASMARRRPVVAVQDAVIVLGLGTVRQLALGFSLIADHGSGSCAEFDYPGFWGDSLLLALAAEAIAGQVGHAAPEEMFACGLLAQIGQLAFATLYPEGYGNVLRGTRDLPAAKMRAVEREQFGLDNVELSVMMLRDWGLADVFVRAVGGLATERRNTLSDQPRVVAVIESLRLALLVLRWFRAASDRRAELRPALLAQSAVLGIEPVDLQTMTGEIATRWMDWAKRLRLPASVSGDPARELAFEALRKAS